MTTIMTRIGRGRWRCPGLIAWRRSRTRLLAAADAGHGAEELARHMPRPEALHSAIGRVVRILSVDQGSPLSLEVVAASIAEALSGWSVALEVAAPVGPVGFYP